ncbi:hypothetical protein QYE76_031454 [Lolium multiflorum]|uniref:Formin-like protein n=1 Tax=Lolium multiflorum TaxID=4521 RepID=A0AAD8QT86_LOLMU|nr:hypothetical protein QYE76_031454 [Lolium multiflorum]
MGMATRCILLLLSVSVMFLLFNFEVLEGALRLAGHDETWIDGSAATTHDIIDHFGFLPRFRMLIGLHHHRHRGHRRSSAAPAPSPAPTHEARSSSAPAPHFHPHRMRMPSARHHSHIAPARSSVRRLGDGRHHTRPPKAAIVALAVVGACLLALGVAIAAMSLRRSRKLRKGCSKPFKLFCHGSRAQRSPSATRKVSSHPSPDPLYLSSAVQCHENYPILKQSSESKSLSIISTSSKSIELITSDHTVRIQNSPQSDEAESFHSIPCSPSSTGSITELPLHIHDKTMTSPFPSSPHTDNSPSNCSYRSFSPDYKSHLPPASNHFSVHGTSQSPSEELDAEKPEVNRQVIVKTNDVSGLTERHEAPKEAQANSKFCNPPEINSPSSHKDASFYHMDASASRTTIASTMSNTKESTASSTEGAKHQMPSAMTVPISPPPPPPPKRSPPSLAWKSSGQPPLPPALPLQIHVGKDGSPLPKLKPLHWDKVRAAPNRSMVWNDIRSNSFEFEFDEQMIKSLFAYNFQGLVKDEDATSRTLPTTKHVIEHHRLQNTTILLKTLNATTEQVHNAIAQGTGLSVQQLEALVKMKPTKEEEEKLLVYDDDIDMLDPAEKFVKLLLAIPLAFQRMEVMLYKETFDDEVVHIKMSFAMIEGACTELRSSKLLLRLLEAVLKTGNRMNIGTLRGGANAFRLDALLKLADVRGADGKTTLLHFVLQELARSKGSKAAEKLGETPRSCHATLAEREEYCKTGTEFVTELSNELGNVKKVASIDLDTMMKSISNLSRGLAQLRDLIEKDLPRNDKNKEFLQYMSTFLNYAENTMQELEVGKAQVLHHVGELTEYYHGEVGKDEPNLLHIFVIIKDFLGLLHRVCREMRGKKQNQPLNLVLPLR